MGRGSRGRATGAPASLVDGQREFAEGILDPGKPMSKVIQLLFTGDRAWLDEDDMYTGC